MNLKLKKLLSMLLVLTMVFSYVPISAHAEGEVTPDTSEEIIVDSADETVAEETTAETTAETTEVPDETEQPSDWIESVEETTESPENTTDEFTDHSDNTEETKPVSDEAVEKVQAMIDALPDTENVTDADYEAVAAAYDAFCELTAEQMAQVVNVEKLTALVDALTGATSVTATSGTCGDNLTWKLSNGTLTITGTGTMTEYGEASKWPWYSEYKNITSIVIEAGVTSVGQYAFSGFTNVTSLEIKGSAVIGKYAFRGCSSLKTVRYGGTVENILNNAFTFCSSVESFTLEEGIGISANAFTSFSSSCQFILVDSDGNDVSSQYSVSVVTNTTNKNYLTIMANLSRGSISVIADQSYTGSEVRPALTVTWNGQTVSSKNYSVSYSNNIEAGTATVTVTGKSANYYTGTLTQTFKIGYQTASKNGDYYEIGNVSQLYWFAQQINDGTISKSANARLTADINFEGREWTPICSTELYYNSNYSGGNYPDTGYAGVFDGQNHIIKNFVVKGVSGERSTLGLFGSLSGTVKNLHIDQMSFDLNSAADVRIAAIAGQILGGTVENCIVTNATITPGQFVAGGIAASNYSGTIQNCFVYGSTLSANRYGYIVADNRADAAGDRLGNVINCYTDKSSAIGSYTGTKNEATVASATQISSGEIAYKLGSAFGQSIGTDSYPVLGGATVYYRSNGCTKYANNATPDAHTFVNGICSVCGDYQPAVVVTDKNYSSLGLTTDYVGWYSAGNLGQFLFFFTEDAKRGEVSGNLVLTSDIEIPSDYAYSPPGISYVTVDGYGHTITINQSKTTATADNFGLFGYYNYSTIRNLILKGSITINNTQTGEGGVGALAGKMFASRIENVISYVSITNTGNGNTGGLVGYYGGRNANQELYSVINNSAVYANISNSGGNIGGIIGCGWGGTQFWEINNCAYKGSITGGTVGSIAGNCKTSQNLSWVKIQNCHYCVEGNADASVVGGGNTPGTLKATSKTADQFASGEVTYLLNGSPSSGVWKQTIGTDSYPNFTGKTVYAELTGKCTAKVSTYTVTGNYANTQSYVVVHDESTANYSADGFCQNTTDETVCNGFQPASSNDGVYEIGNAGQLYWFAEYVNSVDNTVNGRLTDNITVNENVLTSDGKLNGNGSTFLQWTPIGEYKGTFDGNNCAIIGLYCNDSTGENIGFIGSNTGIVQNLTISNFYFKGTGETGAIAGTNTGTIENCASLNGVISSKCCGGIASFSEGSTSKIFGCINTSTVTGDSYVGGICGCTEGIIESCYNVGKVSGTKLVGGIAGQTQKSGTINKCYNVGDVSAKQKCGAIVGSNGGSKNCHSYIINCYFDNDKCSVGYGKIWENSTAENCVGKSTDEFASGEVAWLLNGGITDGSQVWYQILNNVDAYPQFSGGTVYRNISCNGTVSFSNERVIKDHSITDGVCSNCDAAFDSDGDGLYEIYEAKQLCWFSKQISSGELISVKLMNDIDVSENSNFSSIGTFGGTFDGNGHTIKIGLSGTTYVALFSQVSGATIKNLIVDGTVEASDKYAAGIVGRVSGGTTVIENCISNVTINSSVSGDGTHGGLVGVANGGTLTIKNCGFTGSIIGKDTNACGGFIGWASVKVTITNSYVAGTFNLNTDSYNTFSRNPSNVTLTNCYYLEALNETPSGATQMSADKFKSGEVAYKLNGDQSNIIWKQTIDTDAYPNFTGESVLYNETDGKYYNGAAVSVTVSWTSMEFTYTDGDWDPETHTYGTGEWTTTGGEITVKNNGTVAVNVKFAYTPSADNPDVVGKFTSETIALNVGDEKKNKLTLTGKPTQTGEKFELGNIVITIGGGNE